MSSDDFDLHLDDLGGTVSLPADFGPGHVRAVRAAAGPNFELVDPSEYRVRDGARVILRFRRRCVSTSTRLVRLAAAVATMVVAVKVPGATFEQMLQVVSSFQEVA